MPGHGTEGQDIKRPADLSIVERLGGFWYCKGKAFIWIVQGFWKKSVEMEVIFDNCLSYVELAE